MGGTGKAERVALRIAARDKSLLERAARARRTTLSEFVLAASREAAANVLADKTRFVLSPRKMAEFQAALDAPPRMLPKLKALFVRRSVFVK